MGPAAHVNVPDRAIEDWGTAYYGTHFDRLRVIKRKYDPHEVFSFEQSIPPADLFGDKHITK
ncbi:MAG: FAD-dependent oxygenase [Actinomycetia bacterium]|nr:FAD-dependent oxygenase [Actinomycetes bacterium]